MDDLSPKDSREPGEPQPKKSPGLILEHELSEARDALSRPVRRLFFSSLAAGLDLGFSVLLMAVALTAWQHGAMGESAAGFVAANGYAFGFVVVVLGRSELFTEQTSLAVLPVLSGESSVRALGRLWAVVWTGNMVGAAGAAMMVVWLGPRLGVIDAEVFERIAMPMIREPTPTMLTSAVVAGWMMGLLSWLVAASRDTISQVVVVWALALALGLLRLHHSVAGTIEVLVGVFGGKTVGGVDFGWFLLWTTLGNALGGPVFVALLRYGHAHEAKEES